MDVMSQGHEDVDHDGTAESGKGCGNQGGDNAPANGSYQCSLVCFHDEINQKEDIGLRCRSSFWVDLSVSSQCDV